jgi:hypothetical protein
VGRGAYRFLVGNQRDGDYLEDPGLDGRIIVKWSFEKWDGGMNRISLDKDRDTWRAVVNAVMNIGVP